MNITTVERREPYLGGFVDGGMVPTAGNTNPDDLIEAYKGPTTW